MSHEKSISITYAPSESVEQLVCVAVTTPSNILFAISIVVNVIFISSFASW